MRVRLQKGYILRDVQPYYNIRQPVPAAAACSTCGTNLLLGRLLQQPRNKRAKDPGRCAASAESTFPKPTCLLKWL